MNIHEIDKILSVQMQYLFYGEKVASSMSLLIWSILTPINLRTSTPQPSKLTHTKTKRPQGPRQLVPLSFSFSHSPCSLILLPVYDYGSSQPIIFFTWLVPIYHSRIPSSWKPSPIPCNSIAAKTEKFSFLASYQNQLCSLQYKYHPSCSLMIRVWVRVRAYIIYLCQYSTFNQFMSLNLNCFLKTAHSWVLLFYQI